MLHNVEDMQGGCQPGPRAQAALGSNPGRLLTGEETPELLNLWESQHPTYEGKAARGPQGRGEESLVKGSPAPPKLWLPPHQDPCFCTDRTAPRASYRCSGQDSRPEARAPQLADRDRGELPTDAPGQPPARPPSRGQAHSRHSFSSLLSKQSGSPSHCQAPGMHRPLLHMKLPGMLHSLVKLFPGSNWLSVGGKGQGGETVWPRCQGPGPPQLFLPTGGVWDTSGG